MADRLIDPATQVSIRETAGRSGQDSANRDTFQRSFLCKSADPAVPQYDPLVCRQALVNQKATLSLDQYAGLYFDNVTWKLIEQNHAHWEFTFNYTWQPLPGAYTVQMDTQGGTIKQSDAFSQVRYVAPGEVPPVYGTSIGVDSDGNVQGVDRVVPALRINVEARIVGSYIPDPIGYAKTVSSVTGYTNNAPYLGFAAGELLFLGASGVIIGDDPLLTFGFEASSNLTGWKIGPVTNISKLGHDYVWMSYRYSKDANGKNAAIAQGAYVARVYEPADFSVLRIGQL